MSTLYIRDVPDEVAEELKARAAADGSSLSAYVAARLAELVERPSNREIIERLCIDIGEISVERTEILAELDAARR